MFCWIFKWMISNAADRNSELSDAAKGHICHCGRCRQFYETCLTLAEQLKHRAAIRHTKFGERLSKRVLEVVSCQQRNDGLARLRARPVVAAACAASIVLAAGLFLVGRRGGQETGQKNGRIESSAAMQGLFFTEKLAGVDLMEKGFPAEWSGLVEKPLTDEIDNITNDTKSTLQFLFLVACVPVDI